VILSHAEILSWCADSRNRISFASRNRSGERRLPACWSRQLAETGLRVFLGKLCVTMLPQQRALQAEEARRVDASVTRKAGKIEPNCLDFLTSRIVGRLH
jgi:hypothetical protein